MGFKSFPRQLSYAARAYSIMTRLERTGKPLFFKPSKPILSVKPIPEEKPDCKLQEGAHKAPLSLEQSQDGGDSVINILRNHGTDIRVPLKTIEELKSKPPGVSIRESISAMEPASIETRMPKVFRNFLQPEAPMSTKVAIIGPANAGKSTLLNRFVDSEVSIVSPRPQTTRKRTQGVMTVGDTQVIFLDSPGVTIGSSMELKGIAQNKDTSKRLRFSRELTNSPWHCLEEADHLIVLLDAHKCLEHTLTTEDYIFSRLNKANISIPATLVVNKMDLIDPKATILRVVVDKYLESYKHSDLAPVYISAGTGNGVEELRQRLLETATPRPWLFPGHIKTDMSDFERVVETIREAYYSRLHSYLPYIFQQENKGWIENFDGSLYVHQDLLVKRAQHEKILVGSKGRMINEVILEANTVLSQQLQRKVRVFLQVKVVEKFPPT
ncbi:hypothetical protein DSO57_1008457 [Entomophthora muscae]|uniref:Uncharacterized protein n=1 Tax=Entomophthora muscae TaxID=34485 RepID=A0ACC2U5I3_9FUNG|nr:hypothetical protein DSO57_1008457 [Entomophthora muscae]